MVDLRRKQQLTTVGGVVIAGVLCAVAFCYFRPFDLYLLRSWESELVTLADEDVEVRLQQIAALGERSLPAIVGALHSDRQLVATTAASMLRRELDELELRSTDESSRIIADLANELAARSDRPGPHSAHALTQLATRLLLWPINRKLIDGERLVADCELIIRSAKRPSPVSTDEVADEDLDSQFGLASRGSELFTAEMLTPVAGGGLPMQLLETPPLPPQNMSFLTQSPAARAAEPPHFIAVQAPRALETLPNLAADEGATQPFSEPLAVDSRPNRAGRRDAGSVPNRETIRSDLRTLGDLELIWKLAADDPVVAQEAVDELSRRGFQKKHFQLAELLVDPDPGVRVELVRRIPQMSGIDSRAWLLWLTRDPDPGVRKAAIAVIATSSDPALQQRVRELEREETDDDVLEAVRQILNSPEANRLR